jgi:hypothetical protein
MDYWTALEVLGLGEDELTRDRVRRGYLRRLREHPPERDPEGFQRLRAAFERLRDAASDDEPPPPIVPMTMVSEIAPPPPVVAPPPVAVVEKPLEFAPLPPIAKADAPEPLPELMTRVLGLLLDGEAAAANSAVDRWRERSDDFRQVSFGDLARWELLRELLGVAEELPRPVTRALANGILAGDLALARPALEAYRASDEKSAGEASSLLFLRANNIFKQIEGTLWIPKKVDLPFQDVNKLLDDLRLKALTPPRPRPDNPAGGSLAVIFLGLLMLGILVRVLSSSSRPHSYSPPRTIPNFKVPYIPPHITFPKEALFLPPPMPKMVLVGESRYDLVAQLMNSVRLLEKDHFASVEQMAAAAALEPAVVREDCKQMKTRMAALEAAPPAEKELKMLYAKMHVQNMKQRIDLLCANKKKSK